MALRIATEVRRDLDIDDDVDEKESSLHIDESYGNDDTFVEVKISFRRRSNICSS